MQGGQVSCTRDERKRIVHELQEGHSTGEERAWGLCFLDRRKMQVPHAQKLYPGISYP